MTMTRKYGLAGICIALLVLSFLLIWIKSSQADISYQQSGGVSQIGKYLHYNFFATSSPQLLGYGTSTVDTTGLLQATSTNINSWFSSGQLDSGFFVIAGAKQITLFCGRGATSTNNGSTSCSYQVEGDNAGPWLYFNQLTAVASTTNAVAGTVNQDQIIVPSGTSTVAATTLSEGFYAIRCIVTLTTDGVGFCSASAQW